MWHSRSELVSSDAVNIAGALEVFKSFLHFTEELGALYQRVNQQSPLMALVSKNDQLGDGD
jgi:hypothetical protein